MHTQSPHHLAQTLALVPGYFCRATLDGRFAWLSQKWEPLLGYTVDELIGQNILDFVLEEDHQRTIEALGNLATGGAVEGFINRYRTKSGGVVHLRWSASAADGVIYALAADVSREVARRRKLAEAQHLLELAGSIAEVGHWRVDLATSEVFWSPQTFRIHGLDPEGPTPPIDAAIEFYHPDDRLFVSQTVQRATETGESWTFQRRIIREDGQERTVRSRGIVEKDEHGRSIALIGIFQDMTDELRMAEEVRNAERLASVATLAAGIAHEINNPLQYMTSGFLVLEEMIDGLRSTSRNPMVDEAAQVIQDCRHGLEQVRRTVGDLRALVDRPERSQDVGLVDIQQAIEVAIGMTRHGFVRDHGAQVERAYSRAPRVSAPMPDLIQVFLNLLTNAMQATNHLAQGLSRVSVRTFTDREGNVIAEVEDNGTGIAPNISNRIFEPFFTTKPLGIGHGMGLHICRTTMRSLGGDISVDSRQGHTVFRVRLPPGEALSSPTATIDARPSIMIVDDDERVARAVALMLRKQYRTVTETSPNVALQRLLERPVDVLLTDIMMGGMTGWQLAERLVAERPTMANRIVLMSGAAPSEYRTGTVQDYPFLHKPFSVEDLREKVESVLRSEGTHAQPGTSSAMNLERSYP